MADEKKLHPPQWLGRPILHEDHVQDLETRAAINEFHHKMPRSEAEQHAHDGYVKENRERAAAHHLAGMKAAMATGNHEDARKHWAMYDLHLKSLGKDSIGAVPPEIEKRMMEDGGTKPVYKFKAHKGDMYALHEPSKDVAPPQGEPVQKAEKKPKAERWKGECYSCGHVFTKPTNAKTFNCPKCGGEASDDSVHPFTKDAMSSSAKPCKWRLGERRCQRMVTSESGYCHSHVDHWANKIKQKEAAAPAPEMDKAELGHIQKPCPLCNEKQKNLSHHLSTAHEFEMEQRRKNPDDSVVQELGKATLPVVAPAIAPVAAPKAAPPAGTAHLQAPQLHGSVEGFMGALKALPNGDPSRGKLITAHMNHGPFLQALKIHPQGAQIHQMLTQHLNSQANAGIRPGKSVVVAKAEDVESARKLLKGVYDLLKAQVLKFPGNPAPAVDQGAPASVTPIAPPTAPCKTCQDAAHNLLRNPAARQANGFQAMLGPQTAKIFLDRWPDSGSHAITAGGMYPEAHRSLTALLHARHGFQKK